MVPVWGTTAFNEGLYIGSYGDELKVSQINPIALKTAKTLWSFGFSECNRVKIKVFIWNLDTLYFYHLLDQVYIPVSVNSWLKDQYLLRLLNTFFLHRYTHHF